MLVIIHILKTEKKVVCQERENPHLELYQEQNYVAARDRGGRVSESRATFDLKEDYRHGAPKKLSNESPSPPTVATVELHVFFFKALCLLLK